MKDQEIIKLAIKWDKERKRYFRIKVEKTKKDAPNSYPQQSELTHKPSSV